MVQTIVVAGFQHETNTFASLPTEYEDFSRHDGWPGLLLGGKVIETLGSLNIPLTGFLNSASDYRVIPTVWAKAEAGGPVTRDAYDRITSMILKGLTSIDQVDAVYLDLQGSMVVDDIEDGEGLLLSMVRNVIGPKIPLVVSLGSRANISSKLFEIADGIAVYRQYPQLEMAKAGQRAFKLLEKMLLSRSKLCKAHRQIPFLIPLSYQHEKSSSNKDLFSQPNCINDNFVDSVDVSCGFPLADVYHCGPSVVAYGTSEDSVNKAANDFFYAFMTAEPEFVENGYSFDQAVTYAIANGTPGRPIVIADVKDNPGAGFSSDTTGLMRAMINSHAKDAILGCICDPIATSASHRAGLGSSIQLQLGGKNGNVEDSPFCGDFIVEALSEGDFEYTGSWHQGMKVNIGQSVLLRVDSDLCDVRIAVSSERFQCLDQALFKNLGVEPSSKAIIGLKSTASFRTEYDDIASETLLTLSDTTNTPMHKKLADTYHRVRPGVAVGHVLDSSIP